MNAYIHWTPASDTREIRSDLRGPYFEAQTVALPFPWLKPAVPARYRMTPAARIRLLWLRVLSSAFADDVRRAIASAFYPLAIGSGLILAALIIVSTRGQFVTWGGLEDIPTGGAH